MNDTLTTISERIEELDGKISQQRDKVCDADIACKASEFKKKVQENLVIFNGKMSTPKPLSDLTAKSRAVVETEELGNAALLKEAEWIREHARLEKLVDERDTLRAREHNMRAEHRMSYGQ